MARRSKIRRRGSKRVRRVRGTRRIRRSRGTRGGGTSFADMAREARQKSLTALNNLKLEGLKAVEKINSYDLGDIAQKFTGSRMGSSPSSS
jgi:hypothetical protein